MIYSRSQQIILLRLIWKKLRSKLENRNLQVNETKIAEYEMKHHVPMMGKRKLLGSLLDSDKDILRQKSLTICSINKLKHIFKAKTWMFQSKTRVFDCYAASVF